jgi:DNA-binding transcriptional LysR family regulator
MDTRQLAAFCMVVERRSFSQAAERMGVTQPAVSQQIRALEERVGHKLIDRSGRRVEPTEAGERLYRSAQRLLAAEQQLLEELEAGDDTTLRGRLELGASTGPGGTVVPQILCDFAEQATEVSIALSIFDTQTVVEMVAERELELGIVGAARKHRSVVFEPMLRDEVVLVCPPSHPFAGRTITLDELRREPLILMQEGAGVRLVIEDELRRRGVKLRDLPVRLELGLQESVRVAVLEGRGATFISRDAVKTDIAEGRMALARVEGMEPAREIFLVRGAGRTPTRVAQAFVDFVRSRA